MYYQLGLIGYPIEHSMSPWLHRQFLQKSDLPGEYSLIELASEQLLAEKLQQIKHVPFDGFNVTVPYKQEIIPYLDQLDAHARAVGAVNTVVQENGQWVGYNTDGLGYTASLKQHYPAIFQKQTSRVLLIGAGGAARGIFDGLVTAGLTRIDIANRTHSRAEPIAELGDDNVHSVILTLQEAEQQLHYYDLIIQTTNVGMKPNDKTLILSLDNLREDTIVSDIVYQPIETAFLRQAKQKGAAILHGHTMLFYQALYAFELWTSEKVKTETMEQTLKTVLEGR
ncbi:shikimate dehydrogenase [Barrientosiimonas marina]|uniref:Shikimate dehydrogenase (NADP(+)) n=1 Tax=Lentibacillus kimchii TaxID=1542911 RepID=A0ABW2V192_9BACI